MADLLVPSAYATITAAIAAIPADISSDQPYNIIIDGLAQYTYFETVTLSGITVSSTNFITLRGVNATGTPFPHITDNINISVRYTEVRNIIIGRSFTVNGADVLVERCMKNESSSAGRVGLFADRCIFRNNVVEAHAYFNVSAAGLVVLNDLDGIKILGNYIKCVSQSGSGQTPVWILTGITNLEILTNVFETTVDLGSGGKLITFSDDPVGLTFNGNVYSKFADTHDLINYNGTGYTSLSTFNTATGHEATLNTVMRPFQGLQQQKRNLAGLGITHADLTDDFNGDTRFGDMDVGHLSYLVNADQVSEDDVRDSVTYPQMDGTTLTGNNVNPDESDVSLNVQYGANGTEFTGSADVVIQIEHSRLIEVELTEDSVIDVEVLT